MSNTMKDTNVYKSRLIWEPSYQKLVSLTDERRQLLNFEREYKHITGEESKEIRREVQTRESLIADIVKRFIQYNETDDHP